MGMPGRDKEPFKVAFKGYGHAVVMGDANEDRCRHIWERLIAGSGAWLADYIEAAHATVPGRRCDESRLMKPAPCGGHRGAFNVPAFPRWSRRLEMRLGS